MRRAHSAVSGPMTASASARSRMRGVPRRFAEFLRQPGSAGPIPAHCRRLARGRARSSTSPISRRATLPEPAIRCSARWSSSAASAPCLIVPLAQGRDACSAAITIVPPGGPAVHRQADRAVAEFRGAGGDRDGERAAVDRDARGAWSSRPRPPRYCRSSIPRPATSRRCSTRCSTRPYASARRPTATLWTYDGERFQRGRGSRRADGSPSGLTQRGAVRPCPSTPFERIARRRAQSSTSPMYAKTRLTDASGSSDALVELGGVRSAAHGAAAQRRRACSAPSPSTARRCGRSPTSRLRCCRISRRRR